MSIRIASIRIAAPALAVAFSAFAMAGSAHAQANVMKECGTEYQAAKTAKTLEGKTWNQYLAECRVRHSAAPTAAPAAAAPAATAAPTAAAPAANPLKPAAAAPAATAPAAAAAGAKPVSAGRAAETTRQRACGAEWRAKKVELQKANPAMKWPQYWSECNTRMKAAGQ